MARGQLTQEHNCQHVSETEMTLSRVCCILQEALFVGSDITPFASVHKPLIICSETLFIFV